MAQAGFETTPPSLGMLNSRAGWQIFQHRSLERHLMGGGLVALSC